MLNLSEQRLVEVNQIIQELKNALSPQIDAYQYKLEVENKIKLPSDTDLTVNQAQKQQAAHEEQGTNEVKVLVADW